MNICQYDGQRREHQPNGFSRWYGSDSEEYSERFGKDFYNPEIPDKYQLGGDWEYHFNEFGFRGEALDSEADKTIMAVGDSFTFGTGIRWEQTWPYLLREKLLAGKNTEKINLLNLSQGGASNDYITRTTLKNLPLVKPDLLLIHFSYFSRNEFPHENRPTIYHLAPNLVQIPKEDKALYESYYSLYNDKVGFINWIKNLLLIQSYCKATEQDVLFFTPDYKKSIFNPMIMQDPLCRSFLPLLDGKKICDFSLMDERFRVDRARDGSHPGPRSHDIFAESVFRSILDKGCVKVMQEAVDGNR